MEDFVDFIRGQYIIYFLVVLPFTFYFAVPRVCAAYDFTAYRLQQFDLHGERYGSRAALVNFEARALGAQNVFRKCMVVHWNDFDAKLFNDWIKNGVGAVLIVLPNNLTALVPNYFEKFVQLETELLRESFNIPIYFAFANPDLEDVVQKLARHTESENSATALEMLMKSVLADGFQFMGGKSQTKTVNIEMHNVLGTLSLGSERSRMIAVVAYYDSFGAVPALSNGTDSNGSGVAALLELARLFASLYQNNKMRPKYNVVFLLSTGGKFNFQGTRHFIDDQAEQADSALRTMDFALCLDGIGNASTLYLHVSKPPKDGSASGNFVKTLQSVTARSGRRVEVVHKKINLQEEQLAWEHERFSVRRLPGFTLSGFSAPKTANQSTMLDLKTGVDTDLLAVNVHMVAEALARHIYGLSALDDSSIFRDSLVVSKGHLRSWIDVLSRTPRTLHLLGTKHPLVVSLQQAMEHWTQESRMVLVSTDKKEPEFALYDSSSEVLHVYRVKPAVFDLALAALVASYLGLVYLLTANFFAVQSLFDRHFFRLKMKQR